MTLEPYWQDERVQLYLGDCREVLPALGVTADCIVADPPYGETSLEWDRWPHGWLEACVPVTRSLWCFGSLRMYLEHRDEFTAACWKLSQDVIWEKQDGSGFAADRFRRVHEQPTHWYRGPWAGIYHKVPRVPWTGKPEHGAAGRTKGAHLGVIKSVPYVDNGTRLERSVLRVRRPRAAPGTPARLCEKPARILSPLITYACPPGSLVADCFAGSGSTLDAARCAGRRAIGVEKRESQCEQAARRLSQASLFGEVPS